MTGWIPGYVLHRYADRVAEIEEGADRCLTIARIGKPGTAQALPASDRCPWHAPELSERSPQPPLPGQ